MKILRFVFVLLTLTTHQFVFAQAEGDYKSNKIGLGAWEDSSIWLKYTGGQWVASTDYPNSSTANVTISAGNRIGINSNSTCNNITVEETGTLKINTSTPTFSGTFDVKGNLENYIQSATFNNLTVETTGTLTTSTAMTINGTLDIKGNLVNNFQGATFSNGCNITIRSTAKITFNYTGTTIYKMLSNTGTTTIEDNCEINVVVPDNQNVSIPSSKIIPITNPTINLNLNLGKYTSGVNTFYAKFSFDNAIKCNKIRVIKGQLNLDKTSALVSVNELIGESGSELTMNSLDWKSKVTTVTDNGCVYILSYGFGTNVTDGIDNNIFPITANLRLTNGLNDNFPAIKIKDNMTVKSLTLASGKIDVSGYTVTVTGDLCLSSGGGYVIASNPNGLFGTNGMFNVTGRKYADAYLQLNLSKAFDLTFPLGMYNALTGSTEQYGLYNITLNAPTEIMNINSSNTLKITGTITVTGSTLNINAPINSGTDKISAIKLNNSDLNITKAVNIITALVINGGSAKITDLVGTITSIDLESGSLELDYTGTTANTALTVKSGTIFTTGANVIFNTAFGSNNPYSTSILGTWNNNGTVTVNSSFSNSNMSGNINSNGKFIYSNDYQQYILGGNYKELVLSGSSNYTKYIISGKTVSIAENGTLTCSCKQQSASFTYGNNATVVYTNYTPMSIGSEYGSTETTKPANIIIKKTATAPTVTLGKDISITGKLTLDNATVDFGTYKFIGNEFESINGTLITSNAKGFTGTDASINVTGNKTFGDGTSFILKSSVSGLTSECVPFCNHNNYEFNFTGSMDLPTDFVCNNLTLTNGTVNLGNNLSLNNLTFSAGNINMGDYSIEVSPTGSVTGEAEAAKVTGTIKRTMQCNNNTIQTGIGVDLTATEDLGNVTVERKTGSKGTLVAKSSSSIACSWLISATNACNNGSQIKFKWFTADRNGKNMSTALVWKKSNDEFTDLTTCCDLSANTVTLSSEKTFGTYTIGDGNSAMPVELTTFTANTTNNGVKLVWSTATEQNNNKFEIEKALVIGHESLVWSKIGEVLGNGNSNSVKNYSFIDNSISRLGSITGGKYVYRLK